MNETGLFLYLFFSTYITVYVGRVLFTNGRPFLLGMLMGQPALTDSVNRILLTGYYLVNLGYVGVTLTMHPPASTLTGMVASISTSVGRIMLTLGVMHFVNIAIAVTWNRINSKN